VLKLVTSIFIISLFVINSAAYGQNEKNIPLWVKQNTKWWSEEKISNSIFTESIQWLAVNKMLSQSLDFSYETNQEKVPNWVTKMASFWVNEEISNTEFFDAISFLLKFKIIQISLETALTVQDSFKEMEYAGESPLFRSFAYKKDFIIVNDERTPIDIQFELKPELTETYQKIGLLNQEQNAAFIIPIFTVSAYFEPGFYTYYRGECGISCLTAKIQFDKPLKFQANTNTVKILDLLGYQHLTDIDVDRNPSILQNYDKIIVLHNEYVTKTEFEAITKHPKVIYLHPNALYAEIITDYQKDTITLIRGHNYPTPEIRNGFDWEFDNSQFEYNTDCTNWEFYEINNGVMLNCYPENIIPIDEKLLKFIKDY
jgi:hypothetical protein